MAIRKGDKAPEFLLFASDKSEVSLTEHLGQNVLLLFFPLAYTRTCTKELCSMRDNLSDYQDLKATVFGISVDSLHVLAKFKKDNKLNFALLSDFNKEAITAYDVVHEEFSFGMRGVAKRAAFVVDKQGVVRYAEILDNPASLPDFEAIKDVLSHLN